MVWVSVCLLICLWVSWVCCLLVKGLVLLGLIVVVDGLDWVLRMVFSILLIGVIFLFFGISVLDMVDGGVLCLVMVFCWLEWEMFGYVELCKFIGWLNVFFVVDSNSGICVV